MKVSYNWLKWYIPDAPDAQKLHDVLTYHLTEVEGMEALPDGDVIMDVNILPNRAHDLLSHSGIGKELSGQLGISFTDPAKTYTDILAKKEIQNTNLEISIETENCRRYSARIIRGIKIGPSPEWVVKHLESVGQRSINNIVDATNLVMLNCGQPTHAFDLRKFADNKIIIKNAKEGDELELVGREKIVAKLKETDLVIASSNGDTLALGGIKGGANSGIQDDTTDIVIEVGNFDPICIRRTARRIGVLSDAAKRFENNLSPEAADFGMLELSALISEMCPDAIFEEVIDIYPNKQKENKITFSASDINKKVGGNISESEIENILKNYGYKYVSSQTNSSGPRVSSPDAEELLQDCTFEVVIPKLRLDLENPIDMIEEIGRIYGYDKLSPVMPDINFSPKENDVYLKIQNARKSLISQGYKEVMTYTFTKKGDIGVARGAKGKDFLRTNLLDGLKESYELNKNNAALLSLNEVKIFEIGSTFKDGNEEIHVAYVNKKESKEVELSQFALSDAFAESSPKVLGSPHDVRPDHSSNLSAPASAFVVWSQYPFITRDVSVWVGEDISEAEVEESIKNSINELVVVGPTLFDQFSKDGRNSYAFRMVFQAKDRTLTDPEVSEVMQKIEKNLKNISGLELR